MKKVIALLAALMAVLTLCSCEEVTFPDIDKVFTDKEAGTSGNKIKLEYKVKSIGEPSKHVETDIPSGKPRVISLTLDSKLLVVEAGKTVQIGYSVKPKTAYDKSVYYESSDETVVKVDKDGVAVGLKPGAVTVTVRTNDGGFKRTMTVIVTFNAGDSKETDRLVELINENRVKNGYNETAATNDKLRAAANQRAFEEAVDMVNYGDKKMDDVRMTEEDGKRVEMENDIFTDFNIWSKSSKAVYVWGEYTAEEAYLAFVEDDECAAALGVRSSGEESYDYIAAGRFEFDGITYWSILMTSQ